MNAPVRSILATTIVSALLILSVSDAGAQRPTGDVQLEKPPVARNDYEKKVLGILEEILKNQRHLNVPQHDGRIFRILTQSMNAKHVVEIGTSTGYSGIWFGLGLKATGGKLTTYEIDADRARTARENFKRAGMDGFITVIVGDAHDEVTKLKEPIDILFLDADKSGYVDYLKKLLPLVRPGGLIIAHNINPRMADPDYMKAVNTDPNLETVVRDGVGFTLKK